ncbi:DUF1002 domain-containing protein [Limosilactobacillus caecicola]|uniref:DUF1002 domain-containing protein n=1 Tax=Limosilactobacillus caecicola TaxID=2941332 RepID=UPI00203F6A0F|nr:DUF1002 domain-containing protein [Limosilactobacillus caecicola]
MKITTKVIAMTLLATTVVGATVIPVANSVAADTTTTTSSSSTNNTSTLSASYVVYGAGAPQSVYSNLNDTMDVDSSFKKLTATAADYRQYIDNDSSTTNAAMISSVAIAPGDPGSGVKVNIKKYNGQSNITKVTAQQYAMVAQMAGVTDITINVTANRPVSGESALTGVYKAFAADGHQLNSQNTSAANSVLEATQGAIDANSDDSSYAGKLMAAVGQVSKQIAQKKQNNNGQLATKQDIQNMLTTALKSRGIESKTSSSQQTQIVNSLVTFQNSPISSSKSYVNNVTNTINNVKNSSGNLMNKAKEWANSASAKKAEQQASNWLQRFVNWVRSFFN